MSKKLMPKVLFANKIVMLGCGSIGQGVMPLIFRHIDINPSQVTIVTADERGKKVAQELGARFIIKPITKENYKAELGGHLAAGDFLVNLSVDVSSVELIEWAQANNILYIDTVIEPWRGIYDDPNLTPAQRSNYALREELLALKRRTKQSSTAIVAHGANPGLVSHFIKQALLDISAATNNPVEPNYSKNIDWARLAENLGIKVIHIAERDTQRSLSSKQQDTFVNTWSIDGFVSEGLQPAELGWGTHEKKLPPSGARHGYGCDAAIWLNKPGAFTRVRSWTPLEGAFHGFLVTHNESISIADWLTCRDGDKVHYRPTCHYAYHPCDDAVLSLHELAGKNGKVQAKKNLIVDEIVDGMDELGVLLMGNQKGVYWYGSRLTIQQARALAPYNNATSLQVAIAVLAGVIWGIENPCAGIVEAEDMDFRRILEIANPYLGDVVGVWGEWNPLHNRNLLFKEELDHSDCWQFSNILVN